MNTRSEYLKALRREATHTLTWAPNFDWWYDVNTANATIPAEYRGMTAHEISRAVGGAIWQRVEIVRWVADASVTTENLRQDDLGIDITHTPVGDLRAAWQQASDFSRSWVCVEHPVKSLDDLPALRYTLEAGHYELDTRDYDRQREEVGDDGIVLTCLPEVPFIRFAKVDVGYLQAYYLLEDHPREVAAILQAYERNFLEAYRLAAQGPCEVVSNNDNMDQCTCPPDYFQRYAVPFYQQTAASLHAGGKLAQGHWCGQLHRLLPLMPACGLDIIEAMTPYPMSQVDMPAAMELLEGKIAVQGGIPSIYMCEQGCTRDELACYIEDLLDKVGHRRGFVLGMGDNVPANADFARVRLIGEIVAAFNKQRRRGEEESDELPSIISYLI